MLAFTMCPASCAIKVHSWARNLKNVAPQKQNAICKTRAQYAKHNYAFELFKAHCAATILLRTKVFTKNFYSNLMFR
jgi:hypothetical protein